MLFRLSPCLIHFLRFLVSRPCSCFERLLRLWSSPHSSVQSNPHSHPPLCLSLFFLSHTPPTSLPFWLNRATGTKDGENVLGLAFEKQFAQCPTKHDLSSPSLCYSCPVEPDGQWRNEVLVNMCARVSQCDTRANGLPNVKRRERGLAWLSTDKQPNAHRCQCSRKSNLGESFN